MTTTLRLNDCLKKDCDAVLDDIGLSFSAAITIFMREVVRTGAIPFPLRSSRSIVRNGGRRHFMDAVNRIRAQSAVNHDHEWTMEEIDAVGALREDLKNSTTLRVYKENKYRFAYTYHSEKDPKKIRLEVVFTDKDY